MAVMATENADTTEASNPCRNCNGTGHMPDVRVTAITHRATTVHRRCRTCQGTGEAPQAPATPHVEPEWDRDGDIPPWMLGWNDE